MSITSSLNAGVMGLSVHADKLATISDNIANSETYGYKRADAQFQSMVLTERSGSFEAGGVSVATFRDVDAQGSLVTTSSATDISISGRGMLPVTPVAGLDSQIGSPELNLLRTGSFSPDENGYLRTSSGYALLGWPADSSGNIGIASRQSSAGMEPVQINANQFAADPTTNIELGVNLPASATEAGASGAPFTTPIEYFDNLGRSETLTATFTPTVPATGVSNTWTLDITDSATGPAPIASYTLVFDDTRGGGGALLSVTPIGGAAYDPATGVASVAVAGGPMDVTIGRPNSNDQLTQLSASFAPVSITKNGSPIGNLAGIEIDESGFIEAVYDNGARRVIYQIPLGDVPNPDGLRALDGQAYAVSASSGDIYFWDAGVGPVGVTNGFSLEESTTDIAAELTQLIQTQRAYSSNAKIIQTVDEMLQETTNLKR